MRQSARPGRGSCLVWAPAPQSLVSKGVTGHLRSTCELTLTAQPWFLGPLQAQPHQCGPHPDSEARVITYPQPESPVLRALPPAKPTHPLPQPLKAPPATLGRPISLRTCHPPTGAPATPAHVRGISELLASRHQKALVPAGGMPCHLSRCKGHTALRQQRPRSAPDPAAPGGPQCLCGKIRGRT